LIRKKKSGTDKERRKKRHKKSPRIYRNGKKTCELGLTWEKGGRKKERRSRGSLNEYKKGDEGTTMLTKRKANMEGCLGGCQQTGAADKRRSSQGGGGKKPEKNRGRKISIKKDKPNKRKREPPQREKSQDQKELNTEHKGIKINM